MFMEVPESQAGPWKTLAPAMKIRLEKDPHCIWPTRNRPKNKPASQNEEQEDSLWLLYPMTSYMCGLRR
jgi:hypothetical protein